MATQGVWGAKPLLGSANTVGSEGAEVKPLLDRISEHCSVSGLE